MTTSRVESYPASSALSPTSTSPTSTSLSAAAGSGFASRETQQVGAGGAHIGARVDGTGAGAWTSVPSFEWD